MQPIDRDIQVTWRHRVRFTENVFGPGNDLLPRLLLDGHPPRRPKVLIVLDHGLPSARPDLSQVVINFFGPWSPQLDLVRSPLILEGGERLKNQAQAVERIRAEIERHSVDRQSYLVAAGGGALLDVAGYAAATAHRGVRLVRLPTTTLSQCDSGVGVKNGINAFGKKNFIGTFAPPYAVVIDFAFLNDLPAFHKRAGYAEAVKVACVRDAVFFETLEREAADLRQFEPGALRRLIRRCAELHVDHIAGGGDPFEMGSRRPLDFGHWSAHKLEQLSDFSISHGYAVAIGVALDTIYSRNKGWLDAYSAERVLNLLESLGFPLFAPELGAVDDRGAPSVLGGLEEFREHLGGSLNITLLQGIGRGFETHDMDSAAVSEAIDELRRRNQQRHVPEAGGQSGLVASLTSPNR